MRVCHFTSTGLDGHYFKSLAAGLPPRGVRLVCGSLAPTVEPAWLNRAPGVEYFALGAATRAGYPLAALRLSRLLRRQRVDILQTHLFEAGLVGVMAARLAGTATTVVTRHHLDEHWLVDTRVHLSMDRLTAALADHVVVPSNAVRDHMIGRERANPRKIEVIHLGLALEDWRPSDEEVARFRAEFELDRAFVVGSIGRLVAGKGHHDLLAAAARLVGAIPDLKVLLVGEGDARSLADLSAQLGIRERVVFAGHRSDVAPALGAMDVLAHPTLSEAFGQVVVEAMAVGTPVVATDVGGVPEVVTHGTTGVLVAPRAPEALADAIRRLRDAPAERRRLADHARAMVRQRFLVDDMLDRQVACYARWSRKGPGGECIAPVIRGRHRRA